MAHSKEESYEAGQKQPTIAVFEPTVHTYIIVIATTTIIFNPPFNSPIHSDTLYKALLKHQEREIIVKNAKNNEKRLRKLILNL